MQKTPPHNTTTLKTFVLEGKVIGWYSYMVEPHNILYPYVVCFEPTNTTLFCTHEFYCIEILKQAWCNYLDNISKEL